MKPASAITDRAKRYRANRVQLPGKKLCNFCGAKRNIDIDHVTGDETDGELKNLIRLCRSCNTRKGVVQARNKIGVRTRQYNPWKVPTFTQFKQHVRVLLGIDKGDAGKATAAIYATPPDTRANYAERIERNRAKNPPTFGQYAHAVSIHRRGARDEGGAIIHATPKNLRHRYAMKIAKIKRDRR